MSTESCTQAAAAEPSTQELLQERMYPHHLEIPLDESAIFPDVVAERECYTATVPRTYSSPRSVTTNRYLKLVSASWRDGVTSPQM